jgi:hypothetical protein
VNRPKAEASLQTKPRTTYYLLFETELIDLNTVMSRWRNGFYLVKPEYGIASIRELKRRK